MEQNKSLKIFLTVTFVIGMGFQFLYAEEKNTSWLLLAMWAPTLGVLSLRKDGISILKSLKSVQLKWVGIAVVLAILPYLLSQLVIWAFSLGTWNDSFILSSDQLSISQVKKASLVFGNGEQSFSFFALNIIVSVLLGALITTLIAALGEEIGWRGFLQVKLSQKFGLFSGTLATGFLWAYWHIPANLSGINGKENVLLITFLIFPLAVLMMSFILAWLRLKSSAIWPAAVFHGVNNTVTGVNFYKLESDFYENLLNLFCTVIVGFVFVYFMYKESLKKQSEVLESPAIGVEMSLPSCATKNRISF